MRYLDLPELKILFPNNAESDLTIHCLCFHNFQYIKPIRFFRVQSYYTLHIVMEGSGTLMVGDCTYRVKEKDMFFIPPGVNLCYYPDEKSPWKYIWFEFVGSKVEELRKIMEFDDQNHLHPCKNFTGISIALEKLFLNQYNRIPVGYFDVMALFYQIIASHAKQEQKEENVVEEVAHYIHSHFENLYLTIPEICDCFSVSHSHLCKLFREQMGCSMKRYITNLRIQKSCELLSSTNLSIREVAYSVGIANEVHFMKIFKRELGQTPTEYRNQIRLSASR